jgi:hypothetical protein
MRRYRQPEMLLLDFVSANQKPAPMIVSRAAI